MIPKQRLLDFIKPMCFCPCCEGIQICLLECTFALDNPTDYQRMKEARAVLYPEISSSIVESEAATEIIAEDG